ncbi:MAG: serine hydrolase [Verrucomicrobiota bacterium]|nr:serine hydrolase [Verrucomicrobiota bacterium]
MRIAMFTRSLVLLLFMGIASQGFAQDVAAYAITDATSGRVLEARDAEKKLQVGSLTKIATAMVALDWLELSKSDPAQPVTIPESALKIEGNDPISLQPGDQASLRDLLYAALLQSDNIAAQAIAEHVGNLLQGSTGSPLERFVSQMNALARTLHMDRTLFLNPHGLEGGERKLPFSTANDMARLTKYAMGKSSFRFYVSQKEREISIARASGEQSRYMLHNTNELLGINAVDGVKTGKTHRAGECLIVSAAQPPTTRQEGNDYVVIPRRLIVVVLGASDRFGVATQLLARGWQLYDTAAATSRQEN